MNGSLDILMIIFHCVLFWIILIFFIEVKICSICCGSRMNRDMTFEDDEEFNRNRTTDANTNNQQASSSESAQIIGEDEGAPGKLQLRFKRKQKPGE